MASAIRWVSPTWLIWRLEREAVGLDGEAYEWLRLHAGEIQNGRLTSVCQFEIDDEEAAFAYAEERVRAAASRLAVTNRASDAAMGLTPAMQRHDVVASVAAFSDRFVYDDRRRLSGDLIEDRDGLRAALERVFEQFTAFEGHILAVRGDRLALLRVRWSDDAGNETTTLYVFELGVDARISYMGRFDEDDFAGGYGELDRRYYAGEGAAFAEWGEVPTDWMIALNRDDFDRAFGELATLDFHLENRSRSAFPDRSVTELRATFEALDAWRRDTDVAIGIVLGVAGLERHTV